MAKHLETIDTAEAVAEPELCLNCGADLDGEFCRSCGQKKIHRHEFAIKHFFSHIIHEFTHLDSNKILRTLKGLLFKPGLLTEEYLAGRKGRYINPIRVYLTFSALYFLFAWGALLDFRGGGIRDAYRQPWIVAMAKQKGVEPQAFAQKALQKAEKYSAVLRFASVLMSGLFLTIFYFRMKKYYVEHLIFSLYFYSFDFFCKTLFALLIIISGLLGLKLPTPALSLFYPIAFVYLIFAIRRVYKQTWPRTMLKGTALFVCETALFFVVNMIGFITAFSVV